MSAGGWTLSSHIHAAMPESHLHLIWGCVGLLHFRAREGSSGLSESAPTFRASAAVAASGLFDVRKLAEPLLGRRSLGGPEEQRPNERTEEVGPGLSHPLIGWDELNHSFPFM